MPLEQIRPAGALTPSGLQRRTSVFDYSPPTPPESSDNEDQDDSAEWDPHYTSRIAGSSRRNTDPMSLAKLGGVGGVTRSGSWGRHSVHGSSLSDLANDKLRATDSPRLTRSSLLSYRELPGDEDESAIVSDDSPPLSSTTTPQEEERRHSEPLSSTLNDTSHPSPGLHTLQGSDNSNAPASSSRTSTSSSVAAFSLRSVSHRNPSDGSVSSVASSSTSRGARDQVMSKPMSQSPSSFVDALQTGDPWQSRANIEVDATSDSTAQDSGEEASDSPTRRLQHNPFATSAEDKGATLDPRRSLREQDQTMISPKSNGVHLQSDEGIEGKSGSPELADAFQMAPTSDAVAPKSLSPPTAELQASPEELLSTSASGGLSPMIPRRHSGMFMLRSRSQMTMHPNLNMAFNGAGGGRAAARDRARKHIGWENAPFSVLEAQRHARNYGFSRPASPGNEPWDPSIPAPAFLTNASGTDSRAQSPKPLPRASEQPTSSQIVEASTRSRPSPMRQRSEHALSRTALSMIDTELGLHDMDSTRGSLPTSADAVSSSSTQSLSRSQILRSPSGSLISSSQTLLRTPTTEEWSRLLESHGVDFADRRSRSGTNRSTGSAAHLVSRLSLSAMQPSTRSDLGDGDSDMDSDDSDDHDLGAEVLEKLKQLGLSCASSRNGSVLGEDLASLHEEDEDSPVSPQMLRLQQLPDPLTPLASANKTLHPDHGPLAATEDKTPAINLERGSTLRLPRSKRPTVAGDAHQSLQMYRRDSQTGKGISDYEDITDIGRGAYGLVKKARKRVAAGQAPGELVVIKYIIKSRILADCWRRHRVLGPIPVEIHVMDQLRRIHYIDPIKPRPWSPSRPETVEEWRLRKREDVAPDHEPILSHPNICKMIEFFEDHEFYYLVMPCFGKGQDLFDYVENAPDGLDIAQSRSIFGQVADALWFLHVNNIVHRDVKDENVILDGHGNAQLIDFGSAAHVRPGKLFDTFSGTLDYAAAEILQGEKYSGQPQDIWALGVVGFVLLCGECPFWNGEEAIQGLKKGTRASQTLEERCSLASSMDDAKIDSDWPSVDPACPPQKGGAEPDGGGRVDDFADLIARCLEVDPDSRPTAGQICQHRFLAGQQGWTGVLGWQRLKADIVPSCSTS